MIYTIIILGGCDMDELEKKPDAPQASAKKKPEQKNSFDHRKS